MFNSLNRSALAGSAAMLSLIGLCGGVGLWSTSELRASLTDNERISQLLQAHQDADMMHDAIRADVMAALLSADPSNAITLAEAEADLAAHLEDFKANIDRERTLARSADEVAAIAAIAAPLQTYQDSAQALMQTAERSHDEAAAALDGFLETFHLLEGAMEHVTDLISANAHAATARGDQLSKLSTWLMYGALLLSLTASIGLTFMVRRLLVKPLVDLSATMGVLAGGDNSIEVPNTSRGDEIGAMARAVLGFREAAIQKIALEAETAKERAAAEQLRIEAEREKARNEAEQHAAEERRKQEAETQRQRSEAEKRALEEAQRAEMEAERARNEAREREASQAQARVVGALADALDKLAGGDLTSNVNVAVTADYEKLKGDYNVAVKRLHQAVAKVASHVGHIHSGASEISNAAEDLSRRTEQQAASLEETAAALDEITATVTKTASSANDAARVVGVAREDAQQSGDVVNQAMTAMTAIEKSAAQINQIIGVIDEIAFQTNLLALNAGVEAARAGEAGRGFAVVASEVRALAQRSAESAKEIKKLIATSSEQVEQGADLVNRTGESLLRIIERVEEIDNVVREIAASAREQATGLKEVNTAVNQMDQTTQQNAAMVEETTAASRSLATEAESLSQLVKGFRLDDAQGEDKPARRPRAA